MQALPTYRVLQRSFINNTVLEVDDTVQYSGEPGPNLELVKDEDDEPQAVRGRRRATES